ncbi:DUF6934 family protein [Chitinophaga silvisoli]|uniref:Uncharacterized protein n=1 Tax=Chitinophaga silvisoli TaxID=2291814 RepID=A0A3E1NX33_9BACT|nr:hypothetical protein [Chitinophaga silvisoli]RFM32481.1 hypothetical protein DXN04_22615 [Chitinophaga silvisoli]
MSQFERSNLDAHYDKGASAIGEAAVLEFKAALYDGRMVNMRVEISGTAHDLIENVYDLKFGPVDNKGRIDNRSEFVYADYRLIFSSIMRFMLEYLKFYPDRSIGMNSNDDTRDYLRYAIIMWEFDQLNRDFDVCGVNLYVRLNCPASMEYDSPFDFNKIYPETVKLSRELNIPVDNLYNYIVFKLKTQ